MSAPSPDFELAVRSFSSDLYRYAYWLSHQRSDAEDLVQETFQRAWQHWASLHDEKAVKQWLFTILRNEFYRRFDKTKIDTETLADDVDLPESSLPLEDVHAVRQAISRALVAIRDALLLQVLGGLDCTEIARMHDTTSGAIMTRLTRARKWFQAQLAPEALHRKVRI